MPAENELPRIGQACRPRPNAAHSPHEDQFGPHARRAPRHGVGLVTNYGRMHPGRPAFAPVCDELELPFDTTNAVASLLLSGTVARCRRRSPDEGARHATLRGLRQSTT